MELSQMIYEEPGKDISIPNFDIEKLVYTFLAIKKIRKDIPHTFQLSVRLGKSWTGEIMGYTDKKIILYHRDAATKDVMTIIPQHELEAITLNWTPEFSRYFTARHTRKESPRLGVLRLNQLLPKLSESLPKEMRPNLRAEGDWNSGTEEDFLILEDHLAMAIQNLMTIQKEFPEEVTKLKSIAFAKGEPEGRLAVRAQPGELVITLPYESTSTMSSFSILTEQLNQELTKI